MTSKKLSLIALFTALSVAGATIKVPAIIGSIALDVFPALVIAILIGGSAGAIVACFGHLISALFGGMPLGPLHIMIALEMAILVWLFSKLYKNRNKVLAGFIFIIGNALIAPLPFMFLIDKPFYVSIVPSLLIGSSINAVITFLLAPHLQVIYVNAKQQEAER
ncbi:ECF transporter S component [Alkalihalobacillus sp. TS-13]|uniref:ECF transporter S component n=1 Tax=Alkalihalobacillus sp. TS-13 TaxID=2842455 RepID=UPI001C86D697|nr:ECF transporter S component [Alkalihalobacillus sp. TS-13]